MPVHPACCCSPLANLPVLNAVQSAPHRAGTRRSHHSLRVNQPAQAEAGSASSVAPKHHFTAAAKGMQRRDRQLLRESITETDYAVPKIWFSSKIPVCQKEKPSRLNLVSSKKTRLRTLETSCSSSPPAETKQSSKDGPGQADLLRATERQELCQFSFPPQPLPGNFLSAAKQPTVIPTSRSSTCLFTTGLLPPPR